MECSEDSLVQSVFAVEQKAGFRAVSTISFGTPKGDLRSSLSQFCNQCFVLHGNACRTVRRFVLHEGYQVEQGHLFAYAVYAVLICFQSGAKHSTVYTATNSFGSARA